MNSRIFRTMLLVAMLAVAQASLAAVRYLVVNQADQSVACFALADQPVVKVAQGLLVVETADQTVSVSLDQVVNYQFSETPPVSTDIADKAVPAQRPAMQGGHVLFDRLAAGTPVAVYDANGRQVLRMQSEGSVDLDLTGYPKGVYIVTVGSTSYKVANK